MVHFTNTLMFALMTAGARAVPVTLQKRIDQTTIDSVTPWETACDSAGGGAQCNTIAVNAASTLLAAAGSCDQQNAGDQMVTLAKSLNNNAQMITLAQIFVQQPRNSPTSQAVLYCDTAPQNEELNGFFQCQFQGVDESTFVGGLAPGAAGTAPLSGTVSPPGSCPANPSGPVADGVQLNTLVTSPGTPATGGASSSSGSGAASSSSSTASSSGDDAGAGSAAGSVSSSVASAAPAAATSAAAASSSSDSSSFALSNGQEAQSLNAQFQTLSASSSCTSGQDACVNGEFAQCVNGAFATTSCGSGLTCAALPLVNKPGTSITCTTTADAEARIAATGATGGLTGSGSTASASSAAAPASSPAATTAAEVASSTPASSSSSSSFALSNGQEAQSLNAQFETLSASSSCTSGQDACVNGEFAQCVNGAFATTSCGSGLTCAALPLVNKPGTSITCTTTADAEARIAATGATGGLTGSS